VAIIGLAVLGLAMPSWSSDREGGHTASALAIVDDALARDDVVAAVRAWHDAVGAARVERRWDGLVAVGDASLRIGAVPRVHDLPEAGARSLYVQALFRARQQRSLRGMAQVAQRFAWLGDMEVVALSLRMIDSLTPRVAGDAETLAAIEILRVRSELRLTQAPGALDARP
jgi:hypothetical protein